MRIIKPGDPGKKPKRVAKYLFGCKNCGCEFLCDEKEDTVLSNTFYGFDPEKGTHVSEIEVYAFCPNCGKPAESLRTIWRDA